MKQILPYFIILILLSCSKVEENEQELFSQGQFGYECFRIPAIVKTNKGTLLAFAEGRKNGCSDTGNIDLVLRRSTDKGKTWGPLIVAWDGGENTCGNPAPVVDRKTGKIWLLSTWNLGTDHESRIINQSSTDTRRVFVLYSKDDGKTWSGAREITETTKKDNWTWYATGPVHGIQLEEGENRGRLVIPCDHIEAETKHYYSHVIFSDDHGKSWNLGGSTPQHQVNESTVAELDDGRLILNMRNYDRTQRTRKISISNDSGESWSDIYPDKSLPEPICQASLLRSSWKEKGKSLYFFTNPSSSENRENMTLKISHDQAQSWNDSIILHKGPSAYSDLTVIKKGILGCFYEAGVDSPYETITFKTIILP
jgi:sialidase-1